MQKQGSKTERSFNTSLPRSTDKKVKAKPTLLAKAEKRIFQKVKTIGEQSQKCP